MANTLADKYYLKAREGYPYDLEESLENLQYALSYNEEHVGALILTAWFYMEQLHDYARAEEHFVQAMAIDPKSEQAGIGYAQLLLHLREYEKAKKLIDYLNTLQGTEKATILAIEALYFEYKQMYKDALVKLEQARYETFDGCFMDELDERVERVEKKLKKSTPYFFE